MDKKQNSQEEAGLKEYQEAWDPDFRKLLRDFDLVRFKSLKNTIYGLWRDFTYAYLNRAWFTFASENGGAPAVCDNWGLGSNLLDAMCADIRPFYEDHYLQCLEKDEVWEHDYECSSPRKFRQFRQTVYPLAGQGFLVVNALITARPHDRKVIELNDELKKEYFDNNDMIHQCCHCRKVQNMSDRKRWDWIPDWVKRAPERTSHGLCPVCYNYYYCGCDYTQFGKA